MIYVSHNFSILHPMRTLPSYVVNWFMMEDSGKRRRGSVAWGSPAGRQRGEGRGGAGLEGGYSLDFGFRPWGVSLSNKPQGGSGVEKSPLPEVRPSLGSAIWAQAGLRTSPRSWAGTRVPAPRRARVLAPRVRWVLRWGPVPSEPRSPLAGVAT